MAPRMTGRAFVHWPRADTCRVVAVAVTVLMSLTSPSLASATAKSGYFVISPSRSTEFRLKGSGGYSISVFGNRGQVAITAQRGHSSVTYTARGLASSKRIKARFGGLGRVSVRFHPIQPPHLVPEPPGNCKGRGEVVQAGRFVGTIALEGEQGYTTVHASRAKGKVTRALKQTCKDEGDGGGGPAIRWTILSASSESEGIIFTAFKTESKTIPALDGTAFGASIFELRSRRFTIFRSIGANEGPNAFTTFRSGREITSATITPPQPFMGSATYQRVKGSLGTWTGSLAGDFPGRGEVSLAGSGFSAQILH